MAKTKKLKRIKSKPIELGCKFHPTYQGLVAPTSKNKLCTCKAIFEARQQKLEEEAVLISREKKRGDCFVSHGSISRLQEGMVISHSGEEYLVEMVNECRARCRPINTRKKEVSFTNAKGKTFKFQPEMVGASINISPNSECDILRWNK